MEYYSERKREREIKLLGGTWGIMLNEKKRPIIRGHMWAMAASTFLTYCEYGNEEEINYCPQLRDVLIKGHQEDSLWRQNYFVCFSLLFLIFTFILCVYLSVSACTCVRVSMETKRGLWSPWSWSSRQFWSEVQTLVLWNSNKLSATEPSLQPPIL